MQKDPLTHQYRSIHIRPFFFFLTLMIELYLLTLLLTYLLEITTFLSIIPWQLIFVLLLILSSLYYIGIRITWNRHTSLRKRALSSDSTVLAIPQPTPNPYYALSLPTTIILQPDFKRVRNPILSGLITLLIVLVASFFFNLKFYPTNIYLPFLFLTILTTLFILLFWISRLKKARSSLAQQCIEVTEQDLTISYRGKVSSIAWQDARLFAISDFHQRHLPLFYELSGKHSSLLWMQALPNRSLRLHQYLAPTIPFEEYTYQMQALHALIITKTQLPLYNLSKPTQTIIPPAIINPE